MRWGIIILNSSGGKGKDTLCDLMSKHYKVYHLSIINKTKEFAKSMGWNGGKTEKDRKFLAELKIIRDEFNDGTYTEVLDEIIKSMIDGLSLKKDFIIFVDMREPKDIYRFMLECPDIYLHKSVLIVNNRVEDIISNNADNQVYNAKYDYILENNGTLEELEQTGITLIEDFFKDY